MIFSAAFLLQLLRGRRWSKLIIVEDNVQFYQLKIYSHKRKRRRMQKELFMNLQNDLSDLFSDTKIDMPYLMNVRLLLRLSTLRCNAE